MIKCDDERRKKKQQEEEKESINMLFVIQVNFNKVV